jgi:DNA-binding transcriptional LysR family regulator
VIVSLTKLQQLVTVARCESLTRAADVLGISQPALSRAVAFVEDVYQVRIFDRIPQGVVATEAGSAILAEAERLLRNADTFDHNAQLIGGGRLGQVSFGMGPILANIMMARVGAALLAGGRQLSFQAKTRRADYIVQELLEGELEVGLVGRVEFDIPDEIAIRPVGTLRTAVFARPGHPLAGKAGVTLDELREFPIASPMDLNQLRNFRPIAHIVACDDYVAMKDMVRETDAVCVGAALFAQQASANGEVVMLDFAMPASERDIAVIAMTLKGRTTSPAVELVIDCCREVLAADG